MSTTATQIMLFSEIILNKNSVIAQTHFAE